MLTKRPIQIMGQSVEVDVCNPYLMFDETINIVNIRGGSTKFRMDVAKIGLASQKGTIRILNGRELRIGKSAPLATVLQYNARRVMPNRNRRDRFVYQLLPFMHQDNMFVCFIPPYTPLLYSKTGVYRGIHYFLNFC